MATINDPKLIFKIVMQYYQQGDSVEKLCEQYSIQEEQVEFWLHQFKTNAWRVYSPDFLRQAGADEVEEEEAPQIIQQIIIKKVKKGHGGGHHGGSWKVAYADFVTAMMAFFLMLWLIGSVPAETKDGLSEYFEDPAKFLAAGGHLATATSMPTPEEDGVVVKEALMGNAAPVNEDTMVKIAQRARISMLAETIRRDINEKFSHLKGQVLLEPVSDGLKIQMIDQENIALFNPGGTELNKRGQDTVRMLAENLKGMSGKLTIEGHTDATPYKGSLAGNWDLSVMRAVAARKEFQKNGISTDQFLKVVGFADTQLYNPKNPKDPMNRRISIIIGK